LKSASVLSSLKLLTILMSESPRVVSRRDIEREVWRDMLLDSDTLHPTFTTCAR
jgi:DNA-binding winged helix-turn-helix (wHTH) protein